MQEWPGCLFLCLLSGAWSKFLLHWSCRAVIRSINFRLGRGLGPVLSLLLLLLLLIWGSSGGGKLVLAADKFDFTQMNEARERMIMTPNLVSGDDFRKGQIEQRRINISALFRDNEGEGKVQKSRQDDYEARLRRLERKLGQGGGTAVWRPKAGILFGPGFAPLSAADAILRAAPTVMAQLGFIYLDPSQLQAVINNFRYRQALNNPLAVAAFLSEYPGSRYLFFLEGVRLPWAFPGRVELHFFVVDGYAGRQFPRRMVFENVTAAWQVDQALGRCLYQALSLLKPVVVQSRPQGKIFLVQGNMVYLNVGRLSGLRPGQELEVMGPGHQVVDPRTGLSAGYVSGRPHGRIKIIRGFGYDLAEARLLAGTARMGDLVEW